MSVELQVLSKDVLVKGPEQSGIQTEWGTLDKVEQGIWSVRREGKAQAIAKAVTVRGHEVYLFKRSLIVARQVVRSFAEMKYDVLRRLSCIRKEDLSFDLFFDRTAWDALLVEGLHQVFLDTFLESGVRAHRLVGDMSGSFLLYNYRARDWLREKEFRLAGDVNTTTIDSLRSTLEEGYTQGETYNQLSARVSEVFAGTERAEAFRAMRIARTEVNSISNYGLLQGFLEMGIPRKEWLAGVNARPWHAEASGQVVASDQPFIVMGEELMAPGDESSGASPENIINCRCVVSPVIF